MQWALRDLNVAAGLSGMYIVRDEEEDQLNLPRGEYELPLVLQDRTFLPDGNIYYPKRGDVASLVSPSNMRHGSGPWVSNYFGDKILVNGVVWPYVEVEPRQYRIRLVNSSNARFYGLLFENRMEFFQIGSDGGILPKPIKLNQTLLAPAERLDLIVDFSKLKGKSVKLLNEANTPFPGEDDAMMMVRSVMEFRVTKPLTGKVREETPSWSLPFTRYREQDATAVRDFILSEDVDIRDGAMRMLINGAAYHNATTEKPKLGSTEIWQFYNTTDDAHPMHLHLSQFQVMDRRQFDQYEYQQNKKVVFETGPLPPSPGELGWKDTVIAYPGEMVRIIVRFEDYAGKYVYHCHMLEHEDNDMMRPFEVVT
jgi:spore coat protein A